MLQLRNKISHRFFLAIMVIVVIPIAIMGYESTILTKRTLTAFAFQHMATLAETRANHLDSWLEERLDDVGVLSRLPAIREACERFRDQAVKSGEPPSHFMRDTLNLIEERSPSYENIYILLQDGRVLASTHPERADDAVFRDLGVLGGLEDSQEPMLSPVYQYGDAAGWHVQIAARIDGRDGSPLAFIVAVLDLSRTIDPIMVERIGLGETGETYLVNRDRRIISQSRFLAWDEIVDRQFDTAGIRAVLEEKKGTAIYLSYTGQEVLGSYVWMPRYEWGILAEMETDEILWPLQWIKTIGILTTLMVSFVCLLMAYAVSRRVSMPIVQVSAAAELMARGDLLQRIPFSSQDEVGRLAQSFNTMARQLSQSVASLRQKEESLQKAYDELIATQEQLLRSERMAAIGELVASVAHEMRGPLSSIRLNLQIIGRSLSPDTVLREHYEIAFDQVLQMERMFSDLLNYSKPLEIQRQDVRAEDLLERCMQALEGELATRAIRVERAMEPDLPPFIADPDKVEQVLLNVMKNAIEASPQGAWIQVACSSEESAAGGTVTIAVTDQGTGISQRNLKMIFQPFFTTRKKGTGLGLSIVKKIMDAHRGVMLVESEEGRGTIVRLTFPGVRGAE
ncbi:MAG: ATP-binding protein [Syntrophobacteraceae bacterium]|jgi:signal transduction histidine kinase|nr:ATP-binding protein [Syntrophobacteraceae bacterium]